MKRYISKIEESVLQDHITLGKISGVFGLRGEVRVFLHNPTSGLFDKKRPIILYMSSDSMHETKMSCRSGAGKRIIGKIDGYTNVEQARSLIGALICIHQKHLPHTDENEFITIITGLCPYSVRDCIGECDGNRFAGMTMFRMNLQTAIKLIF